MSTVKDENAEEEKIFKLRQVGDKLFPDIKSKQKHSKEDSPSRPSADIIEKAIKSRLSAGTNDPKAGTYLTVVKDKNAP